jgi:hypothetical protein
MNIQTPVNDVRELRFDKFSSSESLAKAAQQARNADAALALYGEAVAAGVTPTDACHVRLVNTCAAAGRPDDIGYALIPFLNR